MEGRWESILVAFGLIAIFYVARKYVQRKKPPLMNQEPKNHSIIYSKKESKTQAVTKVMKRKPSSNLTSSHPTNQLASLVMHPHSLESARKEFVLNAQRFRGSYETLFLTCNGKITGVFREQVLRNWEEGIRATEAKFLILVWTTIVQRHCGRNFYRQGSTRWNREAKQENEILQDWLKQLYKWGIIRELCRQSQAPDLEEESKARIETARWVLNGEILEVGPEQVKSTGQ